MNKTVLKNLATEARRELLDKIKTKASLIGITDTTIKKAEIESSDAIFIDGKPLSNPEKVKRNKLIQRIQQLSVGRKQEEAFKMVIEEVAYTWFNRFTALRFMEVNEYLPSKVRVLSSYNLESHEPDIVTEALSVDLDIDKDYVAELKMNNKTEELFKYMIIKQCNDLNKYLPFMFKRIDDYTEILFPDGLLNKDSFIRKMTATNTIPEDTWKQVEIIGWLYQYYIAEEKDRVIKAKKKYKTEEIPYVTQLFTPDWIVRYMVQNSLGRYWFESHPEHQDLLENWEFYLENKNSLERDFEEKLTPYINKELKVEEIKCFDPAIGSGHILVYIFDVLYEIYSKCGYMEREIPRIIIENNLYGLDIDDRAYQLACFSVVMKAMQYNKRFFKSIEREGLKMNLASIQETNHFNDDDISYIAGENSGANFEQTKRFIEQFKNAKTFGSLIKFEQYGNKAFLEKRLEDILGNPAKDIFEEQSREKTIELLPELLRQAKIMNSKYEVLVTNPPYLGNKFMGKELAEFTQEYYPDTKSDIFSAFVEYSLNKVEKGGHLGFVTPYVWMYISSYEGLRRLIVDEKSITSLIQLEYNAFEAAVVPVCTFTLRNNNNNNNNNGEYIDLSEFKGIDVQPIKVLQAIQDENVEYRYSRKTSNFSIIPSYTIAYAANDQILELFKGKKIGDYFPVKEGLNTGNNDIFLRLWYEVDKNKIGLGLSDRIQALESKYKWFPHNKGGSYRKWYGNNEYLINWEDDGFAIRNYKDEKGNIKSSPRNLDFFFKKGITFSSVSSSDFNCRAFGEGFTFNSSGRCLFPNEDLIYFVTGYLNSKLATILFKMIVPTLNFTVGSVASIPYLEIENKDRINTLVKENIEISKIDWDWSESSWDFRKHPLLYNTLNYKTVEQSFSAWVDYTNEQFYKLKKNEEELNEIFLRIYGLVDTIDRNVDEEGISVSKRDIEKDTKSFISYAVGCMFGRYSLDEEGIIFAGGKFDLNRYKTFLADEDNILPILPGAYFEDDIVTRFVEFVKVTFGEEMLAQNLEFISNALGKKQGETAKETIRRYFLTDFFKNHVQIYKKRPIYWLFTSGKQKAFNCLVYMHRYDKTTLSRIRTDYLHELQNSMDVEKNSLISIIEGDSTTKEISNAKKELRALEKKIEELKAYDELLQHMADQHIEIDLDDGVVVNYAKFAGLVAPIK